LSSMVEGNPAFFAASNYDIGLIIVMSIVFAISTSPPTSCYASIRLRAYSVFTSAPSSARARS
jgi:hypothetical protein